MKKSKSQNIKRYPESIGKISVKNFRVFDTETSFDFKPLTFLIGPNSSGKSSLMKLLSAISLSANKSKNNSFVPRLISSNIGDDSSMGFSFNSSRPLPNEPLEIIINGIGKCQSLNLQFKLSYVDSETVFNKIRLSSFEILRNDKRIIKVQLIPKTEDWIIFFSFKGYYDMSFSFVHALIDEAKSREGLVFKDEIDFDDALNASSVFKLKEMDDFELKTIQEIEKKVFSIDEFISNTNENNNIYHTILLGFESFDGYTSNGLKGFIEYMFFYLKGEISTKLNNLKLLEDLENSELGNILLQKMPEYISNELNKNLNGNLTFNRVPVFKSVRETVFNLLSVHNTAFGLLVKSYIEQNKYGFKNDELRSNDYIDYWLERFEIGKTLIIKSIENSFQYFKIEIIKEDGEIINISDLGYGVGQVLAYILLPYFANVDFVFTIASMSVNELENSKVKSKEGNFGKKIEFNPHLLYNGKIQTHLVYLEEPETNLHPNWQSVLSELFAYQIKIGIRFVIETHSEYFVRKIQNMIAKKECDNKDVVIYYFNSEKEKRMNNQPTIREIHINENGTLNQSFGPGFFDEAGKLSLELLSINSIRKN
jgi:predicted ATPase